MARRDIFFHFLRGVASDTTQKKRTHTELAYTCWELSEKQRCVQQRVPSSEKKTDAEAEKIVYKTINSHTKDKE